MLSERNRELVERIIPGIYTALLDSHLDALLDAARAEGGAGEGSDAVIDAFRQAKREAFGLATGRVIELKTWPGPFAAVRAGLKPWELRLDDRGYQVGDLLRLREWSPESEAYSGEVEDRLVIWKLDGGSFGLPSGFCIMSLAPASGLAAGSHQPVAPQPREEHNSPETGDVEGLVERLENIWNARDEGEIAFPAWVREAADDARATVMTLSRLLQERTRERDDLDRLGRLATNDATAAEARAETAERLLEEVEGALVEARRRLVASGDHFGANEVTRTISNIRKEKETRSRDHAHTTCAPLVANHDAALCLDCGKPYGSTEPCEAAAGAVSPGEEGA